MPAQGSSSPATAEPASYRWGGARISQPALRASQAAGPTASGFTRLELNGVTKTYPARGRRPALDVISDASLLVSSGEFVSLIGPSGCGKSTLLNIVSGLEEPTSGVVALDGDPRAPRLGLVAHMHQRDLLLPWRTVLGNAVLGLELRHVAATEARARALALIARFGLDGFEDAYPAHLSGGMRQRVALLRTMLPQQDLIVLDEPFGALDAITRSGLQEWLGDVLETDRRTTLLVTHDVDEALLMSDRIYVMSKRPGSTVQSLQVPLARPRTREALSDPRVIDLRRQLMGLLAGKPGVVEA